MCDKEVHKLLIQESHINCIFCNKQIQDPGKPKRYFCCDSMRLIKDGFIVGKNCGQVHDYLTADEYIDFYENRHKMKRKSVYHRKYHIQMSSMILHTIIIYKLVTIIERRF